MATHEESRAIIGTSGWNYRHWADGVFYPPTCKPAAWLEFYASVFDTVEINHPSWHCDECHEILRSHHAVPAFTGWSGCPVGSPVAAEFHCLRRHGPAGYPANALRRDAAHIRRWLREGAMSLRISTTMPQVTLLGRHSVLQKPPTGP